MDRDVRAEQRLGCHSGVNSDRNSNRKLAIDFVSQSEASDFAGGNRLTTQVVTSLKTGQIAEALGVKEARVKSHLAHLKADKKLNVVIDEKSEKVSIAA